MIRPNEPKTANNGLARMRPAARVVVTAARLRFYPILMTSFALILGVFPLFVSTGADANARYAIGTGVIVGLLLIPVFYVIVRRIVGNKPGGAAGMQAVRPTSVDAIASDSWLTATIAVHAGSLT